MSAHPPKTTQSTLLHAFAEDLAQGHGDAEDFSHLEPFEAAAWFEAAQPDGRLLPILSSLVDGIAELNGARALQLQTLLLASLDAITADQVIELRDALRAVLVDQARAEIRHQLKNVDIDHLRARIVWEQKREAMGVSL